MGCGAQPALSIISGEVVKRGTRWVSGLQFIQRHAVAKITVGVYRGALPCEVGETTDA